MKQALELRFEFMLQEWVNQNSHTKNFKGVKTILTQIEEEMRLLEMTTEWFSSDSSPDKKLENPSALMGILPATANAAAPTITLVTHADTVYPVDSEFQAITWSADRKRAIGPGVIDDKGGIMIALLVLEELSHFEKRDFNVQLLCTPGEEAGSPGFAKAFERISFKSNFVIGLEPALPDGSVIHSRRGNRWYEVSMSGPGGHAGRDAGRIPNPLEALIKKISALCDTANTLKGVSLSPGALITDTQEFNVIPALATAKLDARFDSNALRDQLHDLLLPHLKSTEWKLVEDCPAMGLDPKGAAFHKAALKFIEAHERKPGKIQMGFGSSDSNYLYRPGLIMIDGMGAIGTGLHTHAETLEVKSLFTRAKIIVDLIEWAAKNK